MVGREPATIDRHLERPRTLVFLQLRQQLPRDTKDNCSCSFLVELFHYLILLVEFGTVSKKSENNNISGLFNFFQSMFLCVHNTGEQYSVVSIN